MRALLAALALLLALPAAAQTERRVALVIGNATYQHDRTLANPRNDAEDIADTFRRIGFEVELRLDLGLSELRAALQAFAARADGADVAAVYYAGHGMEAGGRNWLIPVDARLRSDRDLELEAVALDTLLRQIEGARRFRLVILDACRDNPLAARAQRSAQATRSLARGLARVEPAGATYVAYAAREGTVARDGASRNSPYAAALRQHMAEPGLPLERLFGAVREAVLAATGNEQEPYLYGAFGREPLYLVPPAAQAPPPSFDPRVAEVEFWRSVQASTNAADFEEYLRQFPNGLYAGLARNRIAALAPRPPAGTPGTAAPSVPPAAPPATPAGGWVTDHVLNCRFRWPEPAASIRWLGWCEGGVAHGAGTVVLYDNGRELRRTPVTMARGVPLSAPQASPGGTWVTDHALNCRLQWPEPATSVRWLGWCEGGVAHGAGTVVLYENGRETRRAPVTMERGVPLSAAPAPIVPREQAGNQVAGVPVPPPPPARMRRPVQNVVGIYPERQAVFRDRRADGSDCPECPELVVIPPGSFTMGVADQEEQREGVPQQFRREAQPLTPVTIAAAFALGRTEVTRAQFAAFVTATGWQGGARCDWRAPGFEQGERDPVVCVGWNDAQAYVRWLSERTGYEYRLPSEAEWEYAARAGTRTARWWGERAQDACQNANVFDQTTAQAFNVTRTPQNIHMCTDGHVRTAPVGSFRPNGFGLYDMLGNVWEWTQDCWNENYRGRQSDGRAWQTGDCTLRVVRGGGWDDAGAWVVRSGYRTRGTTDNRNGSYGFRVARTVTP